MKIEIAKWGNSLAFRIPKKLAYENGFILGVKADISIEEGKIIIAHNKKQSRALRLKKILASLEAHGPQKEIRAGCEVGAEIVEW